MKTQRVALQRRLDENLRLTCVNRARRRPPCQSTRSTHSAVCLFVAIRLLSACLMRGSLTRRCLTLQPRTICLKQRLSCLALRATICGGSHLLWRWTCVDTRRWRVARSCCASCSQGSQRPVSRRARARLWCDVAAMAMGPVAPSRWTCRSGPWVRRRRRRTESSPRSEPRATPSRAIRFHRCTERRITYSFTRTRRRSAR
mmetsp:Transcript_10754/g.20823  ORF Transcript_10754/g.20823 Transcript_10754/m.20823 type:complete len:201 (-) Transcript_10754:949-1551(-)